MDDMARKGRGAVGERHWAHLHPELRPCGERHGTHTHPERMARGEQHYRAKLTEAKVREIRQRYAQDGTTLLELAEEFGVVITTIHCIVTRKSWKAVL